MQKKTIKIKSFETDQDAGKTFVQYHEWDTGFFCAPCAAEVHKITLDGTHFDTKQKISAEIKKIKYGNAF